MDEEFRRAAVKKLLVVERDKFRLTLWKREGTRVEGSELLEYPVAIGKRFYRTPKMFSIVDVMDNSPEWRMPDSQWVIDAGLVPGTILADDDPNNPIKSRWIGISDADTGIGIHGTADLSSIGTEASHGCIRMIPRDVEELYEYVAPGTPVYID